MRAEIEGVLGSAVVEAVGQRGGYGPSLAARCALADGRRVFIKAVSPAQNPDSPGMTRREARNRGVPPADAPAPALLHTLDDGEWIALVFEEVDGRAAARRRGMPTSSTGCFAAIRALGDLAPRAPLPTGRRALRRDVHRLAHACAAKRATRRRDPWCRDRLDELAAVEARWEEATAGDGLIHGDVRSDNVLLTDDGRVVFVDWTSTCTGARWFEVLAMLPSIELEGGGEPEAVLARSGLGDLDTDAARAARRRDGRLLRGARPPAGSARPADAARRSNARRATVTQRVAAPVVGPRLTLSQSVQCRPIPKSQSPFSSGMSV